MKDKVNVDVDQKLVDEKFLKIGMELEGVRIMEVLSIIGLVVVQIVQNAVSQGYDIRGLVSDWLNMMAQNVDDMDSELDFGEEYEN